MESFHEPSLSDTEAVSIPAEVVSFFRYLGVDPQKPHNILYVMKMLELDNTALRRIWEHFCGHSPICLESIIDLSARIQSHPDSESKKIPKNFSKTP